MKWVLDAQGNIKKAANGNPIYANDKGEEVEFVLETTLGTLNRLFGEAKTNREQKEAAETKLQAFEGLDVTEARKAIETVKAFDGKQAISAQELESVRTTTAAETKKSLEAKYKPVSEENDKLKSQIKTSAITAFFAQSKYIKEKGLVPADMFQAYFGRHYDIDEAGKIVAKGHDGQVILSKRNPGNVADADETLEILVDGYPNKAQILKGVNQGGGGGGGGKQGGNGGAKPTMTRSQLAAMPPMQQRDAALTHDITDDA